MYRLWGLLIIAVLPALVLAQTGTNPYPESTGSAPPYQPAVPPPSMINGYGYGGWGYGAGGGTAAGSAMNGMANVISAKGSYNLSTSAAAVNMTQAQKNDIQNHQLYTNTYFDMRATNRAATKAERGPQPTMEQIARMARDGAPKPVTNKEVDTVSGKVNWPTLLQQDSFASQRADLEKLLVKQSTYGSLGYSDQMQAREAIETMFQGIKAQIRQVDPQEYAQSREFLQSILYATCKSQLG
jgi:hypothetical protein